MQTVIIQKYKLKSFYPQKTKKINQKDFISYLFYIFAAVLVDKRTMKRNNTAPKLSIMMLPENDNTLNYNDRLFMGDSLDVDVVKINQYSSPYPCRLDFTIIMFCTSGDMVFRVNLEEFHVNANEMIIATRGSIGEFIHSSEDCRIAVIAISDDSFTNDIDAQTKMLAIKFIASNVKLTVPPHVMREMISIYRLMHSLLSDKTFTEKGLAIEAFLKLFSCYGKDLLDKNSEVEEVTPNRQQRLFEDFLSLVHKHYATERGLQYYADRLFITSKYLSRLIHEISGRFASEWIRSYVILDAKALLKSGNMTVVEVSDKLNFPNPSFFSKYFKAATGITPKQYQSN